LIVQQNKDGGQKLLNLYGRFNIILILCATMLYAESFAEFKTLQSASFNKYVDARDTAFNAYLKAQWLEYNSFKSKPLYSQPKPKSIPYIFKKKIKSVGPVINIKLNENNQSKRNSQSYVATTNKDIVFDFFGTKVGFNFDKKMQSAKFYPMNQKGIVNFFSIEASSNYMGIVEDIKETKKMMLLNDWALYMLIRKIGEKIYTNSDDAKLFSWFILNKLGFKTKIAISNKHIVLLQKTKQKLYSTPGYKINEDVFYDIDRYNQPTQNTIYTYPQEYPNATKELDFSISKLPLFVNNERVRKISFKYLSQDYLFKYRYNQNLINFMNSYPQVEYKVYFNTPLQPVTYEDISKAMKKYINGKKASQAINFVLNMVQKSFKYERDQQQFGKEKVMFAEETLFYKSSDCEDRAVLFAYLIKKLFDISVVGIKYKNHMATGLYIPLQGDHVNLHGRRYVIADPTYTNANVGEAMPKYRSVKPESFIVVKL